MGVSGLHWLLKERGQKINLLAVAKNCPDRQIVLLVDFYGFVFYITDKFVHSSDEYSLLLNAAALKQFEFSETSKLKAIVWILITVLRRYGILLEFIGDGSYKLGTAEGDTKTEEWRRRGEQHESKNKAVAETFLSLFMPGLKSLYSQPRSVSVQSSMFTRQIRYTLLEMKSPIWFAEGEADKLIADVRKRRPLKSADPSIASHFASENSSANCISFENYMFGQRRNSIDDALHSLPPIFAVFSNDSDFALISGSHLLLADSFDSEGRLVSVVSNILKSNAHNLDDPTFKDIVIDEKNPLHCLDSLNAQLSSPNLVAKFLQVKVDQLPDISNLAGNDFTKPFIQKYRGNQFQAAAEMIKTYGRIGMVPQVNSLLRTNAGFREAVEFGNQFYDYGIYNNSTTRNDLSIEEVNLYKDWRLSFNRTGSSSDWIARRNRTAVASYNDPYMRSLLSKGCSRGVLPKVGIQLVKCQTYWMHSKLELPIPCDSIGDALHSFRNVYYALFGIPETVAVTEYGRSGSNAFAIVKKFPAKVSRSLTWFAVMEAAAAAETEESVSLIVKNVILDVMRRIIGPNLRSIGFLAESRDHVNIATVTLALMSNLYFPKTKKVFGKDELESVIVMLILLSSRVSSSAAAAQLSKLDKEIVSCFRIDSAYHKSICGKLELWGFKAADDPLGFMNLQRSQKTISRSTDLSGLICSFRSIALTEWIQTCFSHILDLFDLYYGSATGTLNQISLGLLFNGDVFRWVYAAGFSTGGAISHPNSNQCIDGSPIEVQLGAERQLYCVELYRRMLLDLPKTKQIIDVLFN